MKVPGGLFFIVFFQGVFLTISGQGTDTIKLSVPQARDYALNNNTTIQSSKIDIGIADKKIWENLATGLPQLNINANYLHQFVVPQLSFGPFLNPDALPSTGPLTADDIRNAFQNLPAIPLGVKNNTTIDFIISQLIFNGEYIVALKASRIVRQLSEKALLITEDQIKESVSVSYYLILVLRENLKLLNQTRQSLDQMYNETQSLNKQGLNEETDVDQVNINRSNVQTLLTSMESQLNIAFKQFKYLLGIRFEQRVELTDSLAGIVSQGNLMYLSSPAFDIQNSVDFQLVRIQENVSEQLLKLEKAKYYPVISAFYRHEEQTNQPVFNFVVKDVVGASLNLPIFTSGTRSSRVSQARFDLQKARLKRQDAESGLEMEYETARNNYETAYSNFVINRESMNLSRKVYDKTVIKFREGVSTSFELMQIQNQFLTAESNYYNSLLSLLRSKAALDRILRVN
jgi:outer membrane protein